MNGGKIYNTEQRQLILNCFYSHRDSSLGIKEILYFLHDEKISRSTAYRQLEQLTLEGILSRNLTENRSYIYRLTSPCCGQHFHLRCSSCGKTVHLSSQITEIMKNSLEENDFDIEEPDTMLIGKCAECKTHE